MNTSERIIENVNATLSMEDMPQLDSDAKVGDIFMKDAHCIVMLRG